jgi:hypothetical protein
MRAAPVSGCSPVLERRDAVIDEARGTAPHHHVAAFEAHAAHRIAAPLAAPQEGGGQAQGDGDDGRPGIVLVAVLMQAELGTGGIAIDQAGIGVVIGEAGFGGGARGEVEERSRASRARARR